MFFPLFFSDVLPKLADVYLPLRLIAADAVDAHCDLIGDSAGDLLGYGMIARATLERWFCC